MTNQLPKLLFVGAGNIAQSIMKGILKVRPLDADQILATAPTNRNLDLIKDEMGCRISLLKNVRKAIYEFNPDFVLICVKPQVLLSSITSRDTLAQVLKSIPHKCIMLSLLAGISRQTFISAFNLPERNVVRVMLNTAAEVNSTSVFYNSHPEIDSRTVDQIQELFQLLGQPVVRLVDESMMDVATGVCGSGISFFYEVVQAMSDISVKNGLARADSLKVAAQLSIAAGQMLLDKEDSHPCQLRDQVSSPAGTTIFGLDRWHEQSTSQSIKKAVQASIDRAKDLSRASTTSCEDIDDVI